MVMQVVVNISGDDCGSGN